MNDNSSSGKTCFAKCHSVNVKGKWAHLAEKNSQPGDKMTTVFRLS